MMEKGKKASFEFRDYRFNRASLNFSNLSESSELQVNFAPRGTYDVKNHCYELNFDTTISKKEDAQEKVIVEVSCTATYVFSEDLSLDEIPDLFYPNALAIVYPYVRAFISTLFLQANVKPMILPTLNLMGLKDTLKKNSTIVNC